MFVVDPLYLRCHLYIWYRIVRLFVLLPHVCLRFVRLRVTWSSLHAFLLRAMFVVYDSHICLLRTARVIVVRVRVSRYTLLLMVVSVSLHFVHCCLLLVVVLLLMVMVIFVVWFCC